MQNIVWPPRSQLSLALCSSVHVENWLGARINIIMVEKRGYDNTTESPSTHARQTQSTSLCVHIRHVWFSVASCGFASLRMDFASVRGLWRAVCRCGEHARTHDGGVWLSSFMASGWARPAHVSFSGIPCCFLKPFNALCSRHICCDKNNDACTWGYSLWPRLVKRPHINVSVF